MTHADGIREPVGQALHAVLRRAVLDHATNEHRKQFPPVLHVGWPGSREQAFAGSSGDVLDHALRCDVVLALLRGARRIAPTSGAVPMLWLTRRGPLEVGDLDRAWLSSARAATAEAGLPLTLVVINRHGWLDPRSGASREWKRLRQR